MQKLKSNVPIVRALERGLALLQLFSQAKPQQSLTELAREAALDVGTTRRLLQTLMVAGFVDFNETAGKYHLTSRIRDLASGGRRLQRPSRYRPRLSRRDLQQDAGDRLSLDVCRRPRRVHRPRSRGDTRRGCDMVHGGRTDADELRRWPACAIRLSRQGGSRQGAGAAPCWRERQKASWPGMS